jgi:hypothetical protein
VAVVEVDTPRTWTQTAGVPRYEIRATADVEPGLAVDLAGLRGLVGGTVELSQGVVSVVVSAKGEDPYRLARDVMTPLRELSRCGIWSVRRRGVLGTGRRMNGAWAGHDGDDGLGGVREPRRPLPPTGSASAAIDLP